MEEEEEAEEEGVVEEEWVVEEEGVVVVTFLPLSQHVALLHLARLISTTAWDRRRGRWKRRRRQRRRGRWRRRRRRWTTWAWDKRG